MGSSRAFDPVTFEDQGDQARRRTCLVALARLPDRSPAGPDLVLGAVGAANDRGALDHCEELRADRVMTPDDAARDKARDRGLRGAKSAERSDHEPGTAEPVDGMAAEPIEADDIDGSSAGLRGRV